jgi:hypothetical protein
MQACGRGGAGLLVGTSSRRGAASRALGGGGGGGQGLLCRSSWASTSAWMRDSCALISSRPCASSLSFSSSAARRRSTVAVAVLQRDDAELLGRTPPRVAPRCKEPLLLSRASSCRESARSSFPMRCSNPRLPCAVQSAQRLADMAYCSCLCGCSGIAYGLGREIQYELDSCNCGGGVKRRQASTRSILKMRWEWEWGEWFVSWAPIASLRVTQRRQPRRRPWRLHRAAYRQRAWQLSSYGASPSSRGRARRGRRTRP